MVSAMSLSTTILWCVEAAPAAVECMSGVGAENGRRGVRPCVTDTSL